MTCIVGWAEAGAVRLGSDSAIQNHYVKRSLPQGKLTRLANDIILGWAGDHRTCQLFLSQVRSWVPEGLRSEDASDFIVARMNDFECFLRDRNVELPTSQNGNLTLLFGVRDRLYCVSQSMSVERWIPGLKHAFWAIGSGSEAALGAFHVLEKTSPGMEAKQKVLLALAASAQFCCGVRGPFFTLQTQRIDSRDVCPLERIDGP